MVGAAGVGNEDEDEESSGTAGAAGASDDAESSNEAGEGVRECELDTEEHEYGWTKESMLLQDPASGRYPKARGSRMRLKAKSAR